MSIRDRMIEILNEKIQSPATPKGRAAYAKSLGAWSKAASKVAQSYKDKGADMKAANDAERAQVSLEQRVARGDHTALVATLQACVTSMEAWCKTVSGLPNADPKTPTGAALLVFKNTVLPKMEALATEAKTRLPR